MVPADIRVCDSDLVSAPRKVPNTFTKAIFALDYAGDYVTFGSEDFPTTCAIVET
jgi:hypothetical protein